MRRSGGSGSPARSRPPANLRLRTRSAAQTRGLAAALAAVARPGDRIALHGPLGIGKTQFVKGFATGLGVREVVISPSFTLMAEYRGRLPLFHLDLFRIAGDTEAFEGGLLDERQAAGVTVIEWGERLSAALDPERLEVAITGPAAAQEGGVGDGGDRQPRALELRAGSPRYARYLDRARAWSSTAGAAREGAP